MSDATTLIIMLAVCPITENTLGMAFFMGGKEAAKELVRQEALKNVCADALAAAK